MRKPALLSSALLILAGFTSVAAIAQSTNLPLPASKVGAPAAPSGIKPVTFPTTIAPTVPKAATTKTGTVTTGSDTKNAAPKTNAATSDAAKAPADPSDTSNAAGAEYAAKGWKPVKVPRPPVIDRKTRLALLKAEKAKTDTAKADAAKTDTAKAEPAKADTTKIETAKTDTAKTEAPKAASAPAAEPAKATTGSRIGIQMAKAEAARQSQANKADRKADTAKAAAKTVEPAKAAAKAAPAAAGLPAGIPAVTPPQPKTTGIFALFTQGNPDAGSTPSDGSVVRPPASASAFARLDGPTTRVASLRALPTSLSTRPLFGTKDDDLEDEERPVRGGLRKQITSVSTNCLQPQLLMMVKQAAEHFGGEALITSGFRGHGRRGSFHRRCAAVDFQIPGVSSSQLVAFLKRIPGAGGVGTYCHTRSVHLDTGEPRNWHHCGRHSTFALRSPTE